MAVARRSGERQAQLIWMILEADGTPLLLVMKSM